MADSNRKKDELNQETSNDSYKAMARALGHGDSKGGVNLVKGQTAQSNSAGEPISTAIGDSRANAGSRPGNEDTASSSALADGLFEGAMAVMEPAHGAPAILTETATMQLAEGNDPLVSQQEQQKQSEHLKMLTTQVPEKREQAKDNLLAAAAPPECRPNASAEDDENDKKFRP